MQMNMPPQSFQAPHPYARQTSSNQLLPPQQIRSNQPIIRNLSPQPNSIAADPNLGNIQNRPIPGGYRSVSTSPSKPINLNLHLNRNGTVRADNAQFQNQPRVVRQPMQGQPIIMDRNNLQGNLPPPGIINGSPGTINHMGVPINPNGLHGGYTINGPLGLYPVNGPIVYPFPLYKSKEPRRPKSPVEFDSRIEEERIYCVICQ